MATYTFTHNTLNLDIGNSPLIQTGDDLPSRNLVLARVASDGRITARSYKLLSRNLLFANVPHTGRFSNQTFTHNSRNLLIERTVLGGTIQGTKLFPEIVPSALQFKPAKYMVTEHMAQSGEVEAHLWADSPSGASLQLDYNNISDTAAETIKALWDSVNGTHKHVGIPEVVLAGVGQQFAQYMAKGGNMAKWFFTEKPKWESRVKGYGDMKVSLVSRIISFTTAVGGNVPFASIKTEDVNVASFQDCDYVGRGPDETIGPAPAPLWVSSYGAANTMSPQQGAVDWGLYGNNYQVVMLLNGSSEQRLLLVKRDRAGNILWQRLSSPINEGNFSYVNVLPNGDVLVTRSGYGGSITFFLFNSGGTLLRYKKVVLDTSGVYIQRVRVKNSSTLVIVGSHYYYAGPNVRVGLVNIADTVDFGTVFKYTRCGIGIAGDAWDTPDFRILPSGEIAVIHLNYEYIDYDGLGAYAVVKFSADLTTVTQAQAISQNTGTVSNLVLMSDGSYRITTSSSDIIKLSPTLTIEWLKSGLPVLNSSHDAVLDNEDNIYIAQSAFSGSGPQPPQWEFTSYQGENWSDGSIEKLDKDCTTVLSSTWSAHDTFGAYDYNYAGAMSGLDLAYGKFIACSQAGHRVVSHNIIMPTTTTRLTAPPGASNAVARAATSYPNSVSGASTRIANTTGPPTCTNIAAENALVYPTVTWSFSDPGATISWVLTSVGQ